MAYNNPNDPLVITGEDSESGFDQIHSEFLQHFKDEIRISNMGGASEKDADSESARSRDHDTDAADQISTEVIRIAHKLRRDSDSVSQSDESKLFDAGGNSGGGGGSSCGAAQVQQCFVPGTAANGAGSSAFIFGCMSTASLDKSDESAAAITLSVAGKGRSVSKHGASTKLYRKIKEPQLNASFPSKIGSYELKIFKQPEEQHRARYLTEGSRGTVKDQSGQGHPTVKLCGYDQPVPLQVFVGTDVGRMKPHGFYQACKVSNKNSTACVERDIEGTTVIELMFDPKQEMVAVVDCVGILKLRNADVEQRIGLAKSKKKSTCARLIFRVNIPKPDGTFHTLQVASTPIICTQPTGAPEISKKSINQCSVKGGEEMFMIGKNFMKGTVVYFEEMKNDQPIWSKEAEIDQDFFQATHLVCTVPSYRSLDIKHPVQVQIVVHSSGRISDPVQFTYLPCTKTTGLPPGEVSTPMETETTAVAKNLAQEVCGLKRPYDSSPHSDAAYHLPSGDVSADMSLILGHAAAAVEFRDEPKLLQKEPITPLNVQPLFEPQCVIPVMDSLTKPSPSVDPFILPLQPLDGSAGSTVDGIPCFPESKDALPIAGVYDNLYDSSLAQNLVGKVLSTHAQRDHELTDQLSNLIEAAHQNMMSSQDGLLSTRRASLTDQINIVQPSADHVTPPIGTVPSESLEYGEPQSKRMAAFSDTSVDLLMQLIQAENGAQTTKTKEEMNWSSMSSSDNSYSLATNSSLTALANSDSHDSHHASSSGQLENLSSFGLKTFEPVPLNATSVQQPLFRFEHSVIPPSFLHSQMPETKPDPNFTGIDAFIHDSIRYTNSSSPQSMDTSGPAGLFSENGNTNHVGLSFPVPTGDHEDDKSALFGGHLLSEPQKEPASLSGFRAANRSSLPEQSTNGNAAPTASSSSVHMVNIRGESCEVVGMDFRSIGPSAFGAMKTACDELRDIIESRPLPNEAHSVAELNQVTGQNLILHHGALNSTDLAMLGVSQLSSSEHHLTHVKPNLHCFSSQDQAQLNNQQLFSQPAHVEVAPAHSFGSGMELQDLDALMHLGSSHSASMNPVQSLNDVAMSGPHHQVSIEIPGVNHLPDLNHVPGHTAPVLTLKNMSPLATVSSTVTDNCLTNDGCSMQSNLQQSLSELHDLKQQMGFSGPQSPTHLAKMSVTHADLSIAQDANISPKTDYNISSESPKLLARLRVSPDQDTTSAHPLSDCSVGNFESADISSLQGPVDCPQTTSSSQQQILQDDAEFAEIYYNVLQLMSSKGENLSVPMASSSSASLDSTLEGVLNLLPQSSVHGSHVLTAGDASYIGANSSSDSVTAMQQQQPVEHLSNCQSGSGARHVLIRTQDGSQVLVPLSSIMVVPSQTQPLVTANIAEQKSSEYITVTADHSLPTNVTLMDSKQVVSNIVPSRKVICLPPELVSALTSKVESRPTGSLTRQVLVIPSGSLKHVVAPTTLHVAPEQTLSQPSTSADCLFSLAVSTGSGNVKFVPNSATVSAQSTHSGLPIHDRMDHQPMDTSSPFGHFVQGSPDSHSSEPQQQQLRNNMSCKVPTLLYQLLTTDDATSTARGTPTTAPMTSLPNLSVDDEKEDRNLDYISDVWASRQSQADAGGNAAQLHIQTPRPYVISLQRVTSQAPSVAMMSPHCQ